MAHTRQTIPPAPKSGGSGWLPKLWGVVAVLLIVAVLLSAFLVIHPGAAKHIARHASPTPSLTVPSHAPSPTPRPTHSSASAPTVTPHKPAPTPPPVRLHNPRHARTVTI